MTLDGRRFRSTSPETAAGSDTPVGHYHQSGDLVWAEFSGGSVRLGRLAGRCAPSGELVAGYVQVLTDGRTVSGEVVTTPTELPDGRLRLREVWRRADGTTGVSSIEELR